MIRLKRTHGAISRLFRNEVTSSEDNVRMILCKSQMSRGNGTLIVKNTTLFDPMHLADMLKWRR